MSIARVLSQSGTKATTNWTKKFRKSSADSQSKMVGAIEILLKTAAKAGSLMVSLNSCVPDKTIKPLARELEPCRTSQKPPMETPLPL